MERYADELTTFKNKKKQSCLLQSAQDDTTSILNASCTKISQVTEELDSELCTQQTLSLCEKDKLQDTLSSPTTCRVNDATERPPQSTKAGAGCSSTVEQTVRKADMSKPSASSFVQCTQDLSYSSPGILRRDQPNMHFFEDENSSEMSDSDVIDME